MKKLSPIKDMLGDSIFGIISALSQKHSAINLGQGFPDFDGPDFLIEEHKRQLSLKNNQYAPFMGTPNLRREISNTYKNFYDLKYNSDSQITVTCGATEAIYLTIMALVAPGDEVIIFEPFYDSYLASIRLAGGIPVPVTLKAPTFNFSAEDLEHAITDKTKLIILNNPHNPTGKVFTKSELEVISSTALKHDLYVVSDEVYEHMIYDGIAHIPFANLESMYERTITISSAGKTFGVTGWKIGWICANDEITRLVRKLHQYITFSVSTPTQETVAVGLSRLESYLPEFKNIYTSKRDYFYREISSIWPVQIQKASGSYFLMLPLDGVTSKNDVDFCQELIEKAKVATIPPSSFYAVSKEGQRHLRVCFAKKEETLQCALDNLKKYFKAQLN